MKRQLLIIMLSSMAFACNKSNPAPNTPPPVNTNAYIVKTIGISRILLGVDNNYNLTDAVLFGGGNKIILKAGTGNQVAIRYGVVATDPDDVTDHPDGTMPFIDQVIDNGNPPDTTALATVIKLTGFDKQKTGYNQLDLVMERYVWVVDNDPAGYHNNITYMAITEAAGKKNVDYADAFVTKLFTGNINVADVEIAKPLAQNPYITEDEIVSEGQAVYDQTTTLKATSIKLNGPLYGAYFSTTNDQVPAGGPYQSVWVNANNGTVSKLDDYTYSAKFNNEKIGTVDQIVDPIDSTSKVYLRISGFNAAQCGFNQLRLFIVNDGLGDGSLQLFFNAIPATAPSLSFIEQAYKPDGLFCNEVRQPWPHY